MMVPKGASRGLTVAPLAAVGDRVRVVPSATSMADIARMDR